MKQYDGRITTQNLVPLGVATAGSVVELLNLSDEGSVAIQVTGTYTGALTAYGRVNGKDWVALSGFTNVTTGATVATIASGTAGLFRADVSGFEAFRLSADGAVTGTAVVALRAGAAAASNTDVSVSLENSDVQIGAVEIKDATTDDRINVKNTEAAGTEFGAITRPIVGQASVAKTAAYANSLIVKASAGKLYGFAGYNSGPAQFIQVHNSATVPADAAVPDILISVAAASNFSFGAGSAVYPFATGITICNSTTGPTKTIGAADCWINALYR